MNNTEKEKILNHKPKPQIITPFDNQTFQDLKNHVTEVRRLFDWPGIDYHDKNHDKENLFNRWYWHNLPLLVKLHHDANFIALASKLADQQLKPSYSFLSMYGPNGVCPLHTDRPQCQFTIDLQIDSDGEWPIYVDEEPYILMPQQALFYSGTGQKHYRKPMSEDSRGHQKERATFMNLAFFHFVPISWQGQVN
jgi:hypothetical protein